MTYFDDFHFAHSFSDMRFIESTHLVDMVPDWSACRSPSRAKRRHAMGYKTRMVIHGIPKKGAFSIDGGRTFVVHPETMRAIKNAAAQIGSDVKEKLASDTWYVFAGSGVRNTDPSAFA